MRVPTRRDALRLLALAPLIPLAPAAIADPQPPIRDQGIGGTGARPPQPPGDGPEDGGDRGIGGTGVIGTIRRFGSIVVNDLRIGYPKDAAVSIDGAAAAIADLKIGHVVRVVAHADAGGLTTRRIDVTSEVVGPVEAIAKGGMTVLGQRIVPPAAEGGRWKVGDRVAVSGLRRPDGVVVASLIEARESGPLRVAGRIRRGADGEVAIGNLRLTGVTAEHLGRRVVVTGDATPTGLAVTRVAEARALFAPGLRRVSLETYVGRNGRGLSIGSGYDIVGTPNVGLPRRGSVRAILSAEPDRDGRLTVERLRIDTRADTRAPGPGRMEPATPRFEGLRPDLPRSGAPGSAPHLDIDTRSPAGHGPGGFGGRSGFERPDGFGRPEGLGRSPEGFGHGLGRFGGGGPGRR